MADDGKVTEEQAADALRALIAEGDSSDEPGATVETVQETEPETRAAEPAATDEPAAEVTEPPETDDVASLKKRLETIETERQEADKRHEARWKAIQERNAANERILRDRYIRKSTVVDRALKTLKATRTTDGISETEVDRVISDIENTMNPQSASYVQPEVTAPVQEDRAITLNSFLNEKGMDTDEAEEFGKWLRSEAQTVMPISEQDVARDSLDGFLRLAHVRWQEGMREKDKQTQRNDAVEAVRTVQRTQKAAARAASVAGAAPRKQPTASSKEIDWSKMSKDERHDMVSSLLKQSVDQYR